jgi:hypothetical protein
MGNPLQAGFVEKPSGWLQNSAQECEEMVRLKFIFWIEGYKS